MLAATAWEAELSYKRANLDADSVSPKGAAEFRCRSAANPVLAHLISAVARVAQITFKKLISHRFLLITGKFWTRKRFFPLSTAELRRVRHRGGWGMRGSGFRPARDQFSPGLEPCLSGVRISESWAATPAPRGRTSHGLVSMLVN